MIRHYLLAVTYAAASAVALAQDKTAADPPPLVAAREENIRATQRALAPVLQNYVAKLTALKQQPCAPSVPKLRLGMPIGAKLCFAGGGVCG